LTENRFSIYFPAISLHSYSIDFQQSWRGRAMNYADAGVDLSAWHDTRTRIADLVSSTYNARVVGGFGQFGGLFDVSFLKEFRSPVLVSSVDGVGTKLKIAFETGVHDTVGEDIVNHCIDDVIVMGATPLCFLDYLGTGRLTPDVAEGVLKGVCRACRESGVVLIGGETAEMPGFYGEGEYDIAGTIVGAVEKEEIIDGHTIVEGDRLIGLRSNGLHTNGYSLARKIVTEVARKTYGEPFAETGRTFGQELLRPHRSYMRVLGLMERGLVKGCAHITGGGFQENVDRVLPSNVSARIDTRTWAPDPIFSFLQRAGDVGRDDMYRTFNMGVGMVVVVDAGQAERVLKSEELRGYAPVAIGEIIGGDGSVVMEY
jgi:phosphoribosylformylglycinamidine cyclo-ligase